MIDENIETGISFYYNCVICKAHYHDLNNSSNAINLQHVDNRVHEANLESTQSFLRHAWCNLNFRLISWRCLPDIHSETMPSFRAQNMISAKYLDIKE